MDWLRTLAAASLAAAWLGTAGASYAAEIAVSALFNGKAVLVVDGGKPRTLSAGEITPDGVKLVGATSEAAVVEYKGQRQTLALGQGTRVATAPAPSAATASILADSRGHFFTTGQINGMAIRFMVDTGATSVALSAGDARNLGINYRSGKRAQAHTANGVIPIYVIRLDDVRVGDITLNNVEATVSEGPHHTALLGMSFLNRTQMSRSGDTLTLIRRF